MNKRGTKPFASRSRFAGFSLIELLVTVTLIGLLVAIALPSYQNNMRRTQRTDAYAALTTVADRLEQTYNNQTAPRSYVSNLASLGMTTTSAAGYYDMTVAACTGGALADCYLITATARSDGPQWGDTDCRSLTVDSSGRRTSSPDSSACWRE